MDKKLKEKLDYLQGLSELHLNEAKKMMEAGNNQIHILDMLAVPIYNRSMSLINGFSILIEKNFICAAPLIRLQMDNFLRFYATSLVEDISSFVLAIMDEAKISDFRDAETGKRLSDSYLVKKVAKFEPWIPKLYADTSGYIHFSSKHIFNSIKSVKGDYKLHAKVGKEDSIIPLRLKLEAVDAMIELTKLVLTSLRDWATHKDNSFK